MIEIQNLSYRYPRSKDPVFKNVNITIKNGEIVAIIGQNGSGKSTLGRLVAGLAKTKYGEVLIDGEKLNHKKRSVGVVFQNPENQIIFSSIFDELSFAFREMPQPEKEKRVKKALSDVGMSGHEKSNLYELSLGQKQRVIFAEMLAQGFHNLVLDEPTTMIDSAGKKRIHNLILRLKKQGFSILLLTNSDEEILLADRVFLLKNCKVAEQC